MFLNILSVSVVCVLLAYNGWEPDDSHTSIESPALLRIDDQSAEVQYIYGPHRSVNGTACQTTSLYDATDTKMSNETSLYDLAHPDFAHGTDVTDICTDSPDDDDDDEIKNKVAGLRNTTIHMETLRDTTGSFTPLRGSVTRPILNTMQLRVKDYRSVPEKKSAVFNYQIIVNSRSSRVKNTVLLVELRLIVPVLMIIIYIREREAQAAQLKEMRMVHIQKPDFVKRVKKIYNMQKENNLNKKYLKIIVIDDGAIIKGQCNFSQAKKQEKTVPKLEVPGRQQRRRGRGRRQRQRTSVTAHKDSTQ